VRHLETAAWFLLAEPGALAVITGITILGMLSGHTVWTAASERLATRPAPRMEPGTPGNLPGSDWWIALCLSAAVQTLVILGLAWALISLGGVWR
jgi:hypothetical protein